MLKVTKFMNENDYAEMGYPDAGFRLLALYLYWNMVKKRIFAEK